MFVYVLLWFKLFFNLAVEDLTKKKFVCKMNDKWKISGMSEEIVYSKNYAN